MGVIFEYCFGIGALALILGSFVFFWYKWIRYRFVGNHYLYALYALAICIALAVISNIFPIEISSKYLVNQTEYTVQSVKDGDLFSSICSSLFEGVKMMGFGFDRDKLSAYLSHFKELEYLHDTLFGIAYVVTSLIGLFFTSTIVALAIFKSFTIKARTFFKSLNTKKEVYYLFSDPTVTITEKLAEELQRDGHIVVVYLSRASQLTQAGTEFKDNLVGKGFDVRIEAYGDGLIKYLFGKSFNKYFNLFFRVICGFGRRKVRVYGLFSDDETSIELASSFKKAVTNNYHFYRIRRKIFSSNKMGKKVIARLNNQDFEKYISGNTTTDNQIINDSHELLSLLSNAIGMDNVANIFNNKIWKFIKDNRLGDSDFPFLLHHFLREGMPINTIIRYKKKRLNNWLKLLNRQKKKKISDYEMRVVKNYRVFLTYHESDIDIVSHYSDSTLHIVNTLSQYDIISSEFVLANQLTNFIEIPKDENNDYKNNAMHVTFFGFGKINRPIFEKMTGAYQLWHDNINKVHYHIVDRDSITRRESVVNRYSGLPSVPQKYNPKSILTKDEFKKINPPLLFDVTAECDGKDLFDYNTIDAYIKKTIAEKNRFNRDGFEIFVISVLNTMSDIKIASHVRKAIREHIKNKKGKSIDKTIIFVRVANKQTADSFFNNNSYVKSQEDVNNGLLFDRERNDDVKAPIVMFGENALMSTYISKHLETITRYAIEALRSYGDISFEDAAKQWLLTDKRETLTNLATIYSLKPKLALFGIKLDENYQVDAGGNSYQSFLDHPAFKEPYNYSNYDTKMKHLAALEHNRWVAAVSQIYNYGPMPIDEFVGKKYNFASKTPDLTLHVCMLSNAGLEVLRNAMVRKDKTQLENSWNLTLVYDIRAMKKIFESLKQEKGEESKAAEEEANYYRNDPISQ